MKMCEDIRQTLGMKELYLHRKETIEWIWGCAKENDGLRYTQMFGKCRKWLWYMRTRVDLSTYNLTEKAVTFLVMDQDTPIGEGTLILSPKCNAVAGRPALCNGKEIANINALRIQKAYEGEGHISRLMREMEDFAGGHNISRLTIGVEARETRNLAIYLHLGFTEFLFSEWEDGELVLYFCKAIRLA